jgi:hypothetical protein
MLLCGYYSNYLLINNDVSISYPDLPPPPFLLCDSFNVYRPIPVKYVTVKVCNSGIS